MITKLLPVAFASLALFGVTGHAEDKPNVLFISVDDLNDWIEPLGGHPQAITPNFTRLAKQSVNFTRNYCPSPGCNPSRTATMTGRHPATSGMYSNYQHWTKAIPDAVTMGSHFRANGYYSAGAGKIFHYSQVDTKGWEAYFPAIEEPMPEYHYPKPGETVNMPAFEGMYGDFDWAPISLQDDETGDARSVAWISEQMQQERDRPFFLACGIYRPHLPWYVPQEYFDLYPLEDIQLPKVLEDDQADLSERGIDIANRGGGYHKHVTEAGQWKKAVQGYLASISYADAMLGRLLDSLEASPHADNTIIVLWSDHGWQLGEKMHWRKFALWDNVARCPLMIKDARGTNAGEESARVTSLIDIYPTLIEMCGLSPLEKLDGRSLVPLIEDPDREWDHPSLTAYDFSEFAVNTEEWRYLRLIDGSEELYHIKKDPEEWHNLAGKEEYAAIQQELAAHIPEEPAPLRPETLIELQPHHVSPYLSREDYEQRKKAAEAGNP
ncbi:MAG: sulfatase [Verrucomicrobiota bacterium JB023]|nr:sulfatase [Verrucomicrobiota bacterium JB023]